MLVLVQVARKGVRHTEYKLLHNLIATVVNMAVFVPLAFQVDRCSFHHTLMIAKDKGILLAWASH